MGTAMFSSCGNDHEDLYDHNAVALMKANEYAKAFVKQFGDIDPNHTWGFGSIGSRTVIKADMKDYPSDKNPAAITDAEKEYVANWFKTNPGLTEEGLDVSDFFVQHVYGNVKSKSGIWYKYDQNTGVTEEKKFVARENETNMDKLMAGDDELNDFNAATGGPHDVVFVKDGSAKTWSYLSSYNNTRYSYFKFAQINVPGVGVGYYVGLSLYGEKYDNGYLKVGVDSLEYADNWILKITPDENVKRIIAEDLGNSDDFDFNDVVFDVEFVAEGAKITLQAAGGTLPLFINDNEVHEKFGVSTETMVNTGNVNKEPVSFVLPGITSLDQIEITVSDKKAGKYYLKAECGEAPQKICVPVTYQWTSERQSIEDKYPKFIDWVGNSTVNWLN